MSAHAKAPTAFQHYLATLRGEAPGYLWWSVYAVAFGLVVVLGVQLALFFTQGQAEALDDRIASIGYAKLAVLTAIIAIGGVLAVRLLTAETGRLVRYGGAAVACLALLVVVGLPFTERDHILVSRIAEQPIVYKKFEPAQIYVHPNQDIVAEKMDKLVVVPHVDRSATPFRSTLKKLPMLGAERRPSQSSKQRFASNAGPTDTGSGIFGRLLAGSNPSYSNRSYLRRIYSSREMGVTTGITIKAFLSYTRPVLWSENCASATDGRFENVNDLENITNVEVDPENDCVAFTYKGQRNFVKASTVALGDYAARYKARKSRACDPVIAGAKSIGGAQGATGGAWASDSCR